MFLILKTIYYRISLHYTFKMYGDVRKIRECAVLHIKRFAQFSLLNFEKIKKNRLKRVFFHLIKKKYI